MKIELAVPATSIRSAPPQTARQRIRPSRLQHDYLTLDALASDVERLLADVPAVEGRQAALDLGSESCPYRPLVEARGFSVKTLDLSPGADYSGSAEETGLPDASFDLVLCTQVLEHCDDPWKAVREMHRILRPGGHALITAPHVWFFHPHPRDHWRFTQQGLAHLCAGAGFRVRKLLSQGGSVLAAAQIANFLAYGILGRLGAPLYALTNLLGKELDRLIPNQLFCINFACLAQRT